MLSHEETPELEAPNAARQLGLGRTQLVIDGALRCRVQHIADLLDVVARARGRKSAAPARRWARTASQPSPGPGQAPGTC
eukprot:5544038-Alexandrium_andersonii.AAC.1